MFQLENITLEEIIGHLVTIKTEFDVDRRFLMGELADHVINRMGVKPGQLASDLRCSKGWIAQLIKVYRTFPNEEDRLAYSELPYQIFKLAAYTDRPVYWMDIAADRELSSRELGKLIKGEAVVDDLRQSDKIYGSVERCFEAGGRGARYLYDRLTTLIRGVDPDTFNDTLPAIGQAKKEEAETLTDY
jgi:hypothetical protein